jgi:hypothetical protein
MTSVKSLFALCALLAAVPACSSSNTGSSKEQPPIIAIRNLTGRDIQTVTIHENVKHTAPKRVGMMTPVLKDITYTVVRPHNPPPLPNKARVTWHAPPEPVQSRVVSLKEPLAAATGTAGEALMFEIGAGGKVRAYLTHVQP